MSRPEPIFNVPGAVAGLLLVFAAVHGTRQWLSPDMEQYWTLALAFIPARYSGHAAALPGGQIAAVTSFLTHMFVHGDLTHLGMNSVWFLAFGGAVARRLGGPMFFAFAAVTGIAGILLYLLAHWGQFAPVVGASGAVSGLMGGALRLLHGALRTGGLRTLQDAPRSVPLASVRDTLGDRQMAALIAVWFIVNVGIGLSGDLFVPGQGGIAWEAHIGGFFAGLLGLAWFDGNADAAAVQAPEPPWH